jgi:hypothetical protein
MVYVRIKIKGESHTRMVDMDDPDDRSIVGRYWREVARALSGKDHELDKYSRYSVDNKLFDTDEESLNEWYEEADPEELEGPYPSE